MGAFKTPSLVSSRLAQYPEDRCGMTAAFLKSIETVSVTKV